MFETELNIKMEVNNRANWYSFQGYRWLSFYLDLIGSLILLVVTVQFVFANQSTSEGEGKSKLTILPSLNLSNL